jgi:preprotein translocase subunit SecF
MHILKYRTIYFLLSGIILAAAIASVMIFGLKPGLDLKGGALLEVSYEGSRPPIATVEQNVTKLSLGEVKVQPTGERGYFVRLRDVTVEEKDASLKAMSAGSVAAKEERFTSIGPTIGKEIRSKGLVAMVLVSLTVIAYVAFVFRHVSRPVSSWKYGVITILTLLHDITIPIGLFAYLGHVNGAEVDSLFIVALLTILGISINDTLVMFDRIRENTQYDKEGELTESFAATVGRSMDQTTARSLNTSLAVIFSLLALLFFGPETTRNFALTLTVGMIAGTYSSIFLASPLLVFWAEHTKQPAPQPHDA